MLTGSFFARHGPGLGPLNLLEKNDGQMADTHDDVLDIPAVCWASGISERTFYRRLKKGEGPDIVRVDGKRIGVTPEALTDWLRRRPALNRIYKD